MRLTVGLVVAAFFTWLVVRHIDLSELRRALSGVSVAWLLVALAVFHVGYACRIERWRQMLRVENSAVTWRDCALPLMASFAVNNVLPFRAGDLMRSFAFGKRLGASSGVVIATLLIERLLDLMVVLLAFVLASALLGAREGRLGGISASTLAAAAIGLVVALFALPKALTLAGRIGGRLLMRVSPGFGGKFAAEIEQCIETLQRLSRIAAMPKLVGWSLGAWAAEGLVFYFVALAMPALSNPMASWLALPVGTLATLIPSTPGYVGTFDYFTAAAMRELGNGPAAAVAYAYLVHVVLWLPPTLIGGTALIALHTGTRPTARSAPQQ